MSAISEENASKRNLETLSKANDMKYALCTKSVPRINCNNDVPQHNISSLLGESKAIIQCLTT